MEGPDFPQKRLYGYILAFGLIFRIASPVAAQGMVANKGVFGPHHYVEDELSLSMYNTLGLFAVGDSNLYSSDSSNGTYTTFSLLAGWAQPLGEIGVYGSLLPPVNAYRSKGYGAEASLRVLNRGRWVRGDWVLNEGETTYDEDLPYRLYATFNYNRTLDFQDVTPDLIRIKSNTFSAGFRGAAYRTVVSAGVSQSLYEENLRSPSFQDTQALLERVETDFQHGYANRSGYVRLSQDIVPGLWIFTGYTHIGYILGPASSADFYSGGGGVVWNPWRVIFEWTGFKPKGGPSQNYYSLGLSWRFNRSQTKEEATEETPEPEQPQQPQGRDYRGKIKGSTFYIY